MLEIPAIDDPRWIEWTTKLHEHLQEPRSWRMLKRWAKQHRINCFFLRNMVAWLEEQGRARTVKLNGIFHWHYIGETDPAFRRDVEEDHIGRRGVLTDVPEDVQLELEKLIRSQREDC